MSSKYAKVTPAIIATAMVSAFSPVNLVFADENKDEEPKEDLPVLSVTTADPQEETEDKIALTKAASDDSIAIDSLALDETDVTLKNFDPTKKGLQLVSAEITTAKKDESGNVSKSLVPSVSSVAIDVKKDHLPNLKLKQTEVTIDNGSTFVPANYIFVTPDADGTLPIIEISDNVDTSKDGNYTATYTAKNAQGKTTVTLNVTVKTPEEVIRAREEAARQAEAARKAAEAKKAAEEAAAAARVKQVAESRNAQLAAQSTSASAPAGFDVNHPTGDYGCAYAYPQCTYWAYQRRKQLGLPVGSRFGNGNMWANSARALGYWVDNVPRMVGDIMVFQGGQAQSSWAYGHVAIVEEIYADGSVRVSEMGTGFSGYFCSTRVFSDTWNYQFIHY